MREVISIHVGQAGCQIGNACWPLFALEHGVLADGTFSPGCQLDDKMSAFFHHAESGMVVPRSLFLDLDPSIINEIKTGPYRQLYHPTHMIAGREDAAKNYAKGRYSGPTQVVDQILESMRQLVEQCDDLQGFMLFRSFGGGTGSGLSSLVMHRISLLFGKKCQFEFSVLPDSTMQAAVNTVLAAHATMASTGCCFMMDNEALFDICSKHLGIASPNFGHMNALIAQVVSSITAPLRFKGTLNADLLEIQTNLVPQPRLHFPIVSYAPLYSASKTQHEMSSVLKITDEAFSKDNAIVKCDPTLGKCMACCLLCRGDVPSSDISSAITTIKNKHKATFVDWCPTGFKVGINPQAPCTLPDVDYFKSKRAVCLLSNSTTIVNAWASVNERVEQMDKMPTRDDFTFRYTREGMQVGEVYAAKGDLAALEREYRNVT